MKEQDAVLMMSWFGVFFPY